MTRKDWLPPVVEPDTATYTFQGTTYAIENPELFEAIQAFVKESWPGVDASALAEAWAHVMDGRRIGTGLNAARISGDTTNADDWQAIAAEYAYLAADTDAQYNIAVEWYRHLHLEWRFGETGLERQVAVMNGWAVTPDLRPATPWLSLSVALAILRGTHPALAADPDCECGEPQSAGIHDSVRTWVTNPNRLHAFRAAAHPEKEARDA